MLTYLARSGVAHLCGIEGDFDVVPLDETLPETALAPLDRIVEMAYANRPDLRLLEYAVVARDISADLAWRQLLPNFFFAIGFTLNYNPLADDQPTPFAYDPYNSSGLAFLVGLDWRFNPRSIGQAERADAELEQVLAQQDRAIMGVELEIAQAYYEALGHEDRVRAHSEAVDAADAWLRQLGIQGDSGLRDFDDFADIREPLLAYFSARANFYHALFDMQLARVNLALKIGLEDLTVGQGLVESGDDEPSE
jgi:outer membrane protein TolC